MKTSNTKYRHTKNGLIRNMYSRQRGNSKQRGHNPPTYTIIEFLNFCYESTEFNNLYNDWVESGYEKMMSPSFDRADDSKGYSFENFNRFMTWADNKRKGELNRPLGIKNSKSKPIIGIHNKTNEILTFSSMQEAERETGILATNICKCCKGYYRHKSCGGYAWKYKDQ